MPGHLRVLIAEDSVNDTFFIVRELQRGGYQVEFERVETPAAMQAALQDTKWDLIISDYLMPQFGGAAALALYKQSGSDIPFIVVSGALGDEIAVEMLKSGAHNFVSKDHLPRLVPVVIQELRAAQDRRIRRQTETTAAYLASLVESCDDAIIGETLDGIIVSWNAGAERLYGYTGAEVIGHSESILAPSYRPQEVPELLEKVKKGERVDRLETVRLRKDGTPVDVSLTISPVKDASGRIIGASAFMRDITQRKKEDNEKLALIQDLTAALAKANSLIQPVSA
jgi:two-component system, cell cycle sensor histidine kinase and response regulator CckA